MINVVLKVDNRDVFGGFLIKFSTSDIEVAPALEMVHSMVISVHNLGVGTTLQFLLPHSILATP